MLRYPLIGLVLLGATGGTAHADSDGLDNSVVVIGTPTRKVEAPLPVSGAVLDSDELKSLSIGRLADVAGFLPGFDAVSTGSALGIPLSIRGISSVTFSPAAEPAVAIYVDDVYQGSDTVAQAPLFGIARVAVTRGPQDGPLGAGGFAGSVAIASRLPEDTNRLEAEVGAGEHGTRRAELYANAGSRAGLVQANLALFGERHAGYGRNTFDGRSIDNLRQFGVRAHLRVRPAENLEILLTGEHIGRDDRSGTLDVGALVPAPSGLPGVNIGLLDPGLIVDGYDRTISQSVSPASRIDASQVRLKLEWQTNGMRLAAVSSWRDTWYRAQTDQDGSALDLQDYRIEQRYRAFSQSVEIGSADGGDRPVHWNGGLSYTHQVTDNAPTIRSSALLAALLSNLSGIPNSSNGSDVIAPKAKVTLDRFTGHAGLAVELAKGLDLHASARISHDIRRLDASQASFPLAAVLFNFPSVPSLTGRISETLFSPTIELGYTVSPALRLHLSASRAQKGGGFNDSLLSFSPGTPMNEPYRAETLGTVEAGFDFAPSEQLKVSASAFRSEWKNRQIPQNIIVQGLAALRTINCCDLVGLSFEASVEWAVDRKSVV